VLSLSEFAGAAAQLQADALLVNPHHVEEAAEAIAAACGMAADERRQRMSEMRRKVRQTDIFWWVDSFLNAVFARDLNAFPPLEDYIPSEQELRRPEQDIDPTWMRTAPLV
jgi:trehalose 6-phosphate synthase